jgi:diacylglycerol kinase (ATP)
MRMVPRMKALVLLNARAGTRRRLDLEQVIRHAAGDWQIEIVTSERIEDLDAIVDRAESQGIDVVIAAGGDGTVHETAKRLIGRTPALGILPIGSGNGFARHIGLPIDPAASLNSCRAGRIVAIDTATVNGEPFIGVMGVGFDAVVAHRFATSSVRGLETYIREGLQAFSTFTAEEYEVTAGDQSIRRQATVVAVANSGQYGNNARVAPLASLRDGLLDVVIVHQTSLLDAPLLLARLFSGSFHRSASVTTIQAAELTIRREAAGPAHLDGEPITLPAELHVRVKPMSLRLLVPDDCGEI